MSGSTLVASAPGQPLARRLRSAAIGLLAAMPLAAAFANRSGPLLLALCAAFALAAALVEEGRGVLERLVAPLFTAQGVAALAFLAWGAIGLAWSPDPAASARVLAQFTLALAGGLVVARLVGPWLDGPALSLAAAGIALGALVVLVSLATDLAPQRLAGQLVGARVRLGPETLNRGVLTLVVVGLSVCCGLARAGRRGLAALLVVLVAAAAFRSESATAALACLAGAAAFIAARMLPARFALGLARVGIVAALLLAPVSGDLLARAVPERAHSLLANAHSGARVAIARAFGAATATDPWRGIGFGASARADVTPTAAAIDPEWRVMLRVGHPHDAALQVWVELGLPGAALAALTLLLAVEAMATGDAALLAPRLALLAAASAAALVGHGAWQAWWATAIGVAAAWLTAMPRPGYPKA